MTDLRIIAGPTKDAKTSGDYLDRWMEYGLRGGSQDVTVLFLLFNLCFSILENTGSNDIGL